MSNTQKMIKAAGFLMAANLVSRLLGFIRESLMAGLFGKIGATDAYNTAFILPDLLYWLLVGGVLSAAFIPVLSEYIAKEKEEEGWKVVSSVANIIFLFLCGLVIAAMIFAPQFISLQVPGFTPENKALAVYLTRILLLQPVILALSGITMGILNSYKIFWPSAVGTVLYNTCIILFGTLYANPNNPRSIAGFAFGVVVGAAANFLVQVPALRRVGLRYYPLIDFKHPGVRKIISLSLPIIIMYTLNQFQVIVNSNLGSALVPGSLTAIWYSYRLFQLPVGIFALAIGVAVFPTLSEQAALNKLQDFVETISGAIRLIVFITVPISIGMVVLRFPLIRVLFEHGKFTPMDTEATAIPLFYFTLGITAQAIIQILPRAFYALQNTWMPVVLGVVAMAASIAWMYVLVGPLAHGGLALAVTLGAVIQMFLLFAVLRHKLGKIDGKRIAGTFLKTLASAALMGMIVQIWSKFLISWLGIGKWGSIILLVTGALVGLIVFAAVTRIFKMEEYTMAMDMLGRRFKRGQC
ncbi:MAG: putative lipid II flippase MurJ [Candidatus Dichloromethanomonas elyunquensis]|nr:MAG: putative lipid II flippase MurJ [Candidatus Dichloromethanomonas elyunquensis]